MNSGGGIPLVAELLGLAFFVILFLVIWGVTALNKSRSGGAVDVWQSLAQTFGGTFTKGSGFQGNVLQIARPYGAVRLEIKLMSAIQCKASPYHTKLGGTFTHAHASFNGGNGPTWKGSVGQAKGDALFDNHSALATLPDHAMIYSTPQEMMLVIEQHIKDGNVLHAATQLVDDFSKRAAGAV